MRDKWMFSNGYWRALRVWLVAAVLIMAAPAGAFAAKNYTQTGTVSASAASDTTISVSAIYTINATSCGGGANAAPTFQVQWQPAGAGWGSPSSGPTEADTGAVSPYQYTITGLTASTAYDVRVVYNDADGVNACAGASATVLCSNNPVTTNAPPVNTTAPGTVTLSVISDTQINVSMPYTTNSDADGSCSVEYSTVNSWPGTTSSCSPVSGASPRSCSITGLKPGTLYYVRVIYSDPDGISGGQAATQVVSNTTTYIGIGAGTVTTGALTGTSVVVNAPVDGASDTNNSATVQYQYKLTSEPTIWTNFGTAVDAKTNQSMTITGLTISTPYDFRVVWTDASGVYNMSTKASLGSPYNSNTASATTTAGTVCVDTLSSCTDCHSMPPTDWDGVGPKTDTTRSQGDHATPAHTGAGERANCAVCHYNYSPMTNVTSVARWGFAHYNNRLDIYTSNKVSNKIFAAPYDKGIKGGYYKGYRASSLIFDDKTPGANNVCTATYCHGAGDSPVWGNGAASCGSCHAIPPAAGRHGTHSQGYVGYKNNSNAASYNFGCYKCHSVTASHASGPVNVNRAAVVNFDNLSTPTNASGSYAGGSLAGTDGTYNWTNGICTVTYCHSNGAATNVTNPTWNATPGTTCTGCHNNNKAATPNTMATGRHSAHVNNADANLAAFGCVKCHSATVSADRTVSDKSKHVNGAKNIAFDSLNPSGSFTSPNCSSVYCHSSGQSTPNYRSPAWNAGTLDCDGCHGADAYYSLAAGAPDYQNISTTTRNSFNSHQTHVLADSDCVKCHTTTVNASKAVIASSQHLSGARDVSFLKGGNYNSTTKRCDTTDCHGVTAMRWGGTLPASCQSCHSDQGSGTNGSHGYTGKHDRHTNVYGFACEECHATRNTTGNTNHSGGDVSTMHAAEVFFNKTATVMTNIQYGGGGATMKYIQLDAAFGLSGLAPVYTPWTTTTAQSDPLNANRKWTQGRCNTVWCHSNANPMGGTMTYVSYANWSTAETAGCTGCHGGPGTYAAINLSNAHKKHSGSDRYNYACSECHNDTVSTGNSPVTSYVKHVNAAKDVKFDGTNPTGAYTSPNCTSLACHGTGTGTLGSAAWSGAATTCTSCHNYTAASGSPITTGKHTQHINNGDLGKIGCSSCHIRSVQSDNATIQYSLGKHVDTVRSVDLSYGGYTGFYTATFTCRNNYCHSSGQATPVYRVADAWTGGVTYTCNACHGADNYYTDVNGSPDYQNVSTTTRNSFNGHQVPGHVSAAGDCIDCHRTVVNYFGNLTTGTVKHMDAARDVSLRQGGTYSNKRCSSTNCHGTAAIRWGGTLPKSCQSCHSDQGAGTYANHSTMGKHSKHTVVYGFACEECHATKNTSGNTKHSGGDVSTKHAAEVFFNKTATVMTNIQYGGGGATMKYIQLDAAFGLTGLAPVYTPWTTTTALSDSVNTNRKWTQGRCNTVWCHSNANPMGGTMTYVSFANWSTAETAGCTGCHGGPGTYAAINLSNAHKKHSGSDRYNYACSECHNDTVSTGNSPVTSYTKHVNAAKDVKFDGTNPTGAYTSPNCTSLACHGTGTGTLGSAAWSGAATTCTSCHNYTAASGSPITTGKHTQHINNGFLGVFGCSACHIRTVQTDNATIQYSLGKHVDAVKSVDLSFAGYTGFYTATFTCRNNYCHSSGQATPAYRTTTAWTAATTLDCDGCHGVDAYYALVAGAPDYQNISTTTRNSFNGHQVSGHLSAVTDCIDCHNTTVDAAGAIKTGSVHIDGARNVSFALGGTYSNKRCSGTDAGSCHGTTTPRWGSTLTCQDCHFDTGAIGTETDDYVYGNATKATINQTEWLTQGHGKVSGTYYWTGNTAANKACTDCHSYGVAHNNATNPFRLINADTNALCTSCHSSAVASHHSAAVVNAIYTSGNAVWTFTPKCVDCHDPHGDTAGGVAPAEYNGAMIKSKVANAGSSTYGVPSGTPVNMDFPDDDPATGVDFNYASFQQSNFSGICQVCHDSADGVVNYNKTTDNTAHYTGMGKCTSCHSHDNGFAPAGGTCKGCHATGGSGSTNRPSMEAEFGKTSHHINVAWASITEVTCAVCHLEGNSDGSVNSTYHNAVGVAQNTKYPVNLRIIATVGATESATITSNTSGVEFYTASGPYGGTMSAGNAANTFCMGCHDTANTATYPFTTSEGASKKTPGAYDGSYGSIEARYGDTGTTTSHPYSPATYNVVGQLTKAYSPHGNPANNQMKNVVTGAWANDTQTNATHAIGCLDCHNSHGSNALTDDGTSFNGISYSSSIGLYKGGLLKTTATYDPDETTTYSAAADLCFDCHLGDGGATVPKTYTGFGVARAVKEYFDSGRWVKNSDLVTNAFTYKTGASTKNSGRISGGHMGGASEALRGTATGTISGTCMACHDPHGTPTGGFVGPGTTRSRMAPALKGTWMSSPYKEDRAPISVTAVDTNQYSIAVKSKAAPRVTPDFALNNPSVVGGGFGTGNATFGTYGVGGTGNDGFYIDDNTFGIPTVTNVTTDNTALRMTGLAATHITETDSDFGGLCLGCHPKTNIDLEVARTAVETGNVAINVHRAVKGWDTIATAADFFKPAHTQEHSMAFITTNPTTSSVCSSAYWRLPGGYRWSVDPGTGVQVTGTGSWNAQTLPAITNQGGQTTTGYTQSTFHQFPCAKCHSPHATKLPKLMKTNCLDVGTSTAAPKHGSYSYQNCDQSSATISLKPFVCHNFQKSNTSTGGGWNIKTGW